MSSYKIFISYRRKGGYDTAKLIYDRLRLDGYSVSFDIDTLENGNFDNELEKRIKKCKDFIIVLSPGMFDCLSEFDYNPKDDWVRIETAYAIKANRNIIPLILEDFEFPKRKLPMDIKEVSRKNSIDLSPKHFEAAYEKMKSSFLLSKPFWRVRHKKQIRSFILTLLFAFASCLAYAVFTMHLQTKEAKATAGEAVIEREVEIARLRDSINSAKDTEIAKLIDAISSAKEAEISAMKDSLALYRELLDKTKPEQKPVAKTTAKAAAPKPKTTKTTTTKSNKKTR